jgi:hypothetical protein
MSERSLTSSECRPELPKHIGVVLASWAFGNTTTDMKRWLIKLVDRHDSATASRIGEPFVACSVAARERPCMSCESLRCGGNTPATRRATWLTF